MFTYIYSTQLSNFAELEESTTMRRVEKVHEDILLEQKDLNYLTADWASWDKTSQFIKERNQDYIDLNLQNQTFAAMNIDVMIFVNNSGDIVYAKSVETHTLNEKSIPEELLKLVKNGSLLTQAEDDSVSGIILLDDSPIFISCYPIFMTDVKGTVKRSMKEPVQGTLIFGRYLDNNLLNKIQGTKCASLLMYRVDKELPPYIPTKFKNISESPKKAIIEPINEDKIAGYFKLDDISGHPALIMRADFPRDLYLHEKKNINYMYFFLLLTGLMTGVVIKLALDRLFVSRLVGIDSFVTKIRSEKDLSKRLSLKGNDELCRLSREINGMLSEIYLAEQELKTQEREKKVLLDSMNELVIFINPSFNIVWANKAALDHMKISLKEAVGLTLGTTSGIVSPLSEQVNLQQLFLTGNKKCGEYTAEDNSIWFVQAIPVTDDDGKIIGILEIFRDITQKEKVELLRKKEINHRIKNNLQIISSLLDLQAEKFSDKRVIEAFKESENRILSISLIHQELYESGKLDLLDFASYLHKLIADLLKSYNAKECKVQVHMEVDSVLLFVNTAVSLGIIINELFTNSIKYAFPERVGGEIRISLVKETYRKEVNENEISLNVPSESLQEISGITEHYKLVFSDNGIGLPEEINLENPDTLGLQLVNTLVEQIDGRIELKRDHETEFDIWFIAPGNKN